MRHGKATCHKYISTLFDSPAKEHIAFSEAILLGDLLFQRSQELIYAKYDFSPESIEQAREIFQSMVNETILGQMMDVDFSARDILAQEDEIMMKDSLKTAMYSFVRPMMTGALLTKNYDSKDVWFQDFGMSL